MHTPHTQTLSNPVFVKIASVAAARLLISDAILQFNGKSAKHSFTLYFSVQFLNGDFSNAAVDAIAFNL